MGVRLYTPGSVVVSSQLACGFCLLLHRELLWRPGRSIHASVEGRRSDQLGKTLRPVLTKPRHACSPTWHSTGAGHSPCFDFYNIPCSGSDKRGLMLLKQTAEARRMPDPQCRITAQESDAESQWRSTARRLCSWHRSKGNYLLPPSPPCSPISSTCVTLKELLGLLPRIHKTVSRKAALTAPPCAQETGNALAGAANRGTGSGHCCSQGGPDSHSGGGWELFQGR